MAAWRWQKKQHLVHFASSAFSQLASFNPKTKKIARNLHLFDIVSVNDFLICLCLGNAASFIVVAGTVGFCLLVPVSGLAFVPLFVVSTAVGTAAESGARAATGHAIGHKREEQ